MWQSANEQTAKSIHKMKYFIKSGDFLFFRKIANADSMHITADIR